MDLFAVLIVFHEYFPQTVISGWCMDVHWQPAGRRSARSDGRFVLKVRGQLNLHLCCTTTRYSSLQQGGIKHVSEPHWELVSLVWSGKTPHSPTTPSSRSGCPPTLADDYTCHSNKWPGWRLGWDYVSWMSGAHSITDIFWTWPHQHVDNCRIHSL